MKRVISILSIFLISCGNTSDDSELGVSGSELDFTLSIHNAKGDDLLKSETLNSYKANELRFYSDKSLENEVIYQWWSHSKYISKDAWLKAAEPNSGVTLPASDYEYVDARTEEGFLEKMIDHESDGSFIPMTVRTEFFEESQSKVKTAEFYLKLKEDIDTLVFDISFEENKLGRLQRVLHNNNEVFNYLNNPESEIVLIK